MIGGQYAGRIPSSLHRINFPRPLKDKLGLSWQVIPKALPEMLMDENSDRVMRSMLQMRKIDIAALRRAQAA